MGGSSFFFRLDQTIIRKSKLIWVIFKLFLDSLNKKIFLSDIVCSHSLKDQNPCLYHLFGFPMNKLNNVKVPSALYLIVVLVKIEVSWVRVYWLNWFHTHKLMGQISWHDFLIFSDHTDYFMKRVHLWSLLLFSNSINVKTTKLSFSGLVKNNRVKEQSTLLPGS